MRTPDRVVGNDSQEAGRCVFLPATEYLCTLLKPSTKPLVPHCVSITVAPVNKQSQADSICSALDAFRIELPSWGFANTGTRFGKFLQPAAASTIAC